MLKKYPNELVELLRTSGLDVADFTTRREQMKNETVFSVQFRDTKIKFAFWVYQNSADYFMVEHTPYTSQRVGGVPHPAYETKHSHMPFQFSRVTGEFRDWLDSVKLYLADQKTLAEDAADSDLWSDFASWQGDSPESTQLSNAPFTDAERERIAASLGQFKTQVLELGVLSHDQLALLNGKVDQLIQDAKSPWMGRREWLGTFAGGLVGFIIEEALRSGAARRLLQLAGEAVGWISQHPIFLPPAAF